MPDLTILVVDNDKRCTQVLAMLFKQLGYRTLMAHTRQRALDLKKSEIIHAVVVDIRLVDNDSLDDQSGIDLLREFDSSFHRIAMTAQMQRDVRQTANIAHEVADAFLVAKDFPEKLVELLPQTFSKIHLNHKLKITSTPAATWTELVGQLKDFRDLAAEQRKDVEAVLQDLTCRLFFDAEGVRFFQHTPGHGSCVVALAQPTYREGSGPVRAVKFGPRASIEEEVRRYNKWVKRLIGKHSTRIEEGPVFSRDLGALSYMFVGDEDDGKISQVHDFHFRYHDDKVNADTLVEIIAYLFETSCLYWYKRVSEEPSDPNTLATRHLDELYRAQLSLDSSESEREVVRQCRTLLKHTVRRSTKFALGKDGSLEVRGLAERPLLFRDPARFALQEWSTARGSSFFSVPHVWAITHGDLHGRNVIVDKANHTWLIDFFKTGESTAFRDFAELESDIKFTMLESNSLHRRYELECVLVAQKTFAENSQCPKNVEEPELRAWKCIREIRHQAHRATGTNKMTEYYAGLLFYALKRIIGFVSSSGGETDNISRYHALLSAAMICNRLYDLTVVSDDKYVSSHADEPSKARADAHVPATADRSEQSRVRHESGY
jgi:CheY-like chemotaxis protein